MQTMLSGGSGTSIQKSRYLAFQLLPCQGVALAVGPTDHCTMVEQTHCTRLSHHNETDCLHAIQQQESLQCKYQYGVDVLLDMLPLGMADLPGLVCHIALGQIGSCAALHCPYWPCIPIQCTGIQGALHAHNK